MSRKFSIKRGINLVSHKSRTEEIPIEDLPPPERVIIPLLQHIGTASIPVVKQGDRVTIGQPIAGTSGFLSASVHASVAGTVRSIAPFPHHSGKEIPAIEIENDQSEEHYNETPFEKPWIDAISTELLQKIADSGVVGMGGAGFPPQVKLSPPGNKPIDTLIINGTQCEPYCTADHRLLVEMTEQVLSGSSIICKIIHAKKCFVAVEERMRDALSKVADALSGGNYPQIVLARVRSRYPQGSERQLIEAIARREVPAGGLPMDTGCIVHNVATSLAVHEAIMNGVSVYERVLTVSGPTASLPKNLRVRIGTPVRALLNACQVDLARTKKVLIGGPMMGLAQSSIDIPVTKTMYGIVTLDHTVAGVREYPCIGCSKCAMVCPMRLIPSHLAKLVEKDKLDEAQRWMITSCIECGCCAYVCPSKINLVHYLALGKFHINARRKTAQ